MPYLLRALFFLIQTVFGFFIVVFLLRLQLIAVGASFYEPICQFVYRLTNPAITPLRRFVPRWRKLELASLLVAWLLVAAESLLLHALFGGNMSWAAWLPAAFVDTLDWIILIQLAAIFVYCLLSFFPSVRYDDNYRLLDQFVAPVVRPFRRLIPPVAGLDFSCWFAWIALILARLLLVDPLRDAVGLLR